MFYTIPKAFIILKIQSIIIIIKVALKDMTTCLSENNLLIFDPVKAPVIAPTSIKGSIDRLYAPKPVDNKTFTILVAWERNIITIEDKAASFVEYPKTNIINATLIGPPPIPKKVDILPRRIPIIVEGRAPLKFRDLTFCLFSM